MTNYNIEVELDHRFGTPLEAIFEVNRPFLFLIEDITSDTIAFVGKVTNPLSQGSPIVSIPLTNILNQTQTHTQIKRNYAIYKLEILFIIYKPHRRKILKV